MRTGWRFFPEICISSDSRIPNHPMDNDSMYVRFGGIRNTKAWSKSRILLKHQMLLARNEP